MYIYIYISIYIYIVTRRASPKAALTLLLCFTYSLLRATLAQVPGGSKGMTVFHSFAVVSEGWGWVRFSLTIDRTADWVWRNSGPQT